MQVLLAAATELELAPFMQDNPLADILITGVGAAASMYHLTKRLQQIDYDLVIQAGIAGSFRSSLFPGELVVVKKDVFADSGLKEKGGFYTLFEMGLADGQHVPYSDGWLVNPETVIRGNNYREVTGITVNTITDDKQFTDDLIGKFDPDIETMEGAALHYVCLCEEVPFLQLRTISNYVGERDKLKWELKLAINNLNIELQHLFKKLIH